MQNNDYLEELREKLPIGSKKLICERTGLNHKTVRSALNGKRVRLDSYNVVIECAKEIIKDYNLKAKL